MKFNKLKSTLTGLCLSLCSFYVEAVCNPSKQACLEAPKGLIAGNAKAQGAVTTWNWLLGGICASSMIFFGIKASNRLSDSQFFSAVGPGLGCVISGIMLYLAFSIGK